MEYAKFSSALDKLRKILGDVSEAQLARLLWPDAKDAPGRLRGRRRDGSFPVEAVLELCIRENIPLGEVFGQQARQERAEREFFLNIPECVRRALRAQAAFFEGISEEEAAPICDNIMSQLRTTPAKKAGD